MLDCDAHLLEGTLDVIKQQLHAHDLHTCGNALLPDMGLCSSSRICTLRCSVLFW